jgi:hypothetical protein
MPPARHQRTSPQLATNARRRQLATDARRQQLTTNADAPNAQALTQYWQQLKHRRHA